MKNTVSNMAPKARHEKLVVREMGEEVVLYDRTSQKALCLNPTAAFVWQHCDGQTTIEELAVLLQAKLGTPVSEQLVWYTLGELAEDHLLDERLEQPPKGMTRREMMAAMGLAGMSTAAAPTIVSIIAPTVASAASAATGTCIPNGAVCTDANGKSIGTCCPGLHCQINKGNGYGHCSPND